jgi:hypothetical protein
MFKLANGTTKSIFNGQTGIAICPFGLRMPPHFVFFCGRGQVTALEIRAASLSQMKQAVLCPLVAVYS